ncbi:MAG: MerR family DNA-binding transcriptional regulator [Hyphomicrobium sp.]|nr:MerR family DNA-binding transcriptional regulator [Hyphomicrobium sp.]
MNEHSPPKASTSKATIKPSIGRQSAPRVEPDVSYTISDLSKEFGITTRTIRFYESRGLIQPERIGTSRRYSRRDRARLILILRGRNLGFTVEDVGEYLALYDADPGQQAQTRLLLDKVSSAILTLEGKRRDIERALAELGEIRSICDDHLTKQAGK